MGIIANPASGKDIRRLTAHATTVDNQGKIGIVRRALIGLGALGVDEVWLMPDTHFLGERAVEGLRERPLPRIKILEMPVTGQPQDSQRAAELLRAAGAGCIITLGGDGTVRMAAKGAGEVPLLPISTGTNNVLPSFVEGTIAGLAAGAVAKGLVALETVAVRHKWLELWLNGQPHECALVDIAALAGQFVGARAVWNVEDLRQVIVTRAHPANMGMSAVVGVVCPITVEEPVGAALTLDRASAWQALAAVGPGLVRRVGLGSLRAIAPGERVEIVAERPLLLAFDGERELVLRQSDTAAVVLRTDGPWIVDTSRVMETLVAKGFLQEHI